VDRIVIDPHRVDDATFVDLRKYFSDEEIIDLVCASSLFTWAGTLNTVVRLDTDRDGKYRKNLAYATAPVPA
jgi:alkylhydroperoxidase family enzyme